MSISFNSNGGIFPSDNSTKIDYYGSLDGTVYLNSIIETPIKQSYIFIGWSTTTNGSVEYAYNSSPIIADNTELYAVWISDDIIGIIAIYDEPIMVHTWYSGTSIPDNSIGSDGDLFLVVN